MRVSILVAGSVLAISSFGTLATPVDGEDGTIDPALLGQASGGDQDVVPPADAQGQLGDARIIRPHELNGRKMNEVLFAETLDELESLLKQILQFPDWKQKQFQRLRANKPPAWTCEDTTESLEDIKLMGIVDETPDRPAQRLSVQKPDVVQPFTQVYPEGPWVKVKVTQDKPYHHYTFAKWPTVSRRYKDSKVGDPMLPGGVKGDKSLWKDYEPTGMSYESLYNIVDGIMIVQPTLKGNQGDGSPGGSSQNPAPAPLTELQLPEITTWAELTFYVWNHLRDGADGQITNNKDAFFHFSHRPGHNLLQNFWPYAEAGNSKQRQTTKTGIYSQTNNMNYVIVPNIGPGSMDLLKVIRECLRSRDTQQIPTMENREKFGVGHWCFYALLGAGNGGIARLLAQHREGSSHALGHKIIKSISIFKPTEKSAPSLLFSITDYDRKWDTLRQAIEADWNLEPENDVPVYLPSNLGCNEDL